MKCANCTHWEERPEYQSVKGLGLCKKAPMLSDVTEWREPENPDDYHDRVLTAEHADTLMFVQDGLDFIAKLFTKPEFFCAHFTEGK